MIAAARLELNSIHDRRVGCKGRALCRETIDTDGRLTALGAEICVGESREAADDEDDEGEKGRDDDDTEMESAGIAALSCMNGTDDDDGCKE